MCLARLICYLHALFICHIKSLIEGNFKYIYVYDVYICIIYLHHVPKRMSCHKVNVVITGRAHCFHDYIYITAILLLWDLNTLCVVDYLCPFRYVLYIHIHIKVNYAINRIYEKTFRSDLPTQKNLSFDELLSTSFFCCYLFVLGKFARFFYEYFFYWAFLLIS